MHANVVFVNVDATQADPARRGLHEHVIPRTRQTAGFVAGYWLEPVNGKGVSVTTLTKPQIRNGRNGAELETLTSPQRDAFLRNTPLWFYILRESELDGGKLRGVGARLVAETFHRAMEGSEFSIVRDPTWRPTLGPDPKTFRMVDLLLFAANGRKSVIAPLG